MTQPHPQPQRCIHECVCHSYLDYQSDDLDPCLAKKCEHDTRPHTPAAPATEMRGFVMIDRQRDFVLWLKEHDKAEREQVLEDLSLPRDAVLRFSRIMETKLKEKDGLRDGWDDCDPVWLFERAGDEMKELKKEITMYMNHSSLSPKWLVIKERIQREAADVANFCMMISDNMELESLRGGGAP